MQNRNLPKIALVWAQFTAYHTDRCVAVAEQLDGRAEILAVEVASTSHDYAAFPRSGTTGKAHKRTVFADRAFDAISGWRRFVATLATVRSCRTVCLGVPYSYLDFVLLAWVLRLLGKRVILMCDSKFDDRPRNAGFELVKGLGLSCFSGAMVAGTRGRDYFRFLGFRRRPILFGYDTVGVERIRAEAASLGDRTAPDFPQRDFISVGRFVEKKNLSLLIEAFADFCRLESASRRRLVLVGSGPLEAELRCFAAERLPPCRVVFTGFLSGPELSAAMAPALGLILASHSEQWGLVVNEALALGLPVIVSESPGSRDVLVGNGINGYVVETGSKEALVRAMRRLSDDRSQWQAMSQAASERAWLGDVKHFADAVELLFDPAAQPAGQRAAAYRAQFDREHIHC